jgi:pantoate--beta-alanine ligase
VQPGDCDLVCDAGEEVKELTMWVTKTVEETRKARGHMVGSVALVPTMGALHAGHASLITQAKALADHVVVSVFVNPTQFGPKEDFSKYPRPIEKDLAMCKAAGASGVFNPGVADVYPDGGVAADVTIPSLASILEGAARPGHFAGVCRVVAKLFNITQPNVALFGKKDYQQLAVIRAMVADLNMPLSIHACETVRESDGLAMSSRNVYLSAEDRVHARGISLALREAKAMILEQGETDPKAVESAMEQVIRAHRFEPGYSVVRHARTLEPMDTINPKVTHELVLLAAAKIGGVRLIDNMEVGG